MSKRFLKVYGTVLVYGIGLALCAIALTGCASNAAAHRFIDDWGDARSDGTIDPGEIHMLDKDAAELEGAMAVPAIPPTGIPWLDLAVSVATAGVAGIGAHKYTMKKRDASRAEALAEVKTA